MRVFKRIVAKIKQYQFFKMVETKKCSTKKIILLAIFALLALVFSLSASYEIEVAKLEKDLQKKHDNESSDILYYLSNDITKAMSSLKVLLHQSDAYPYKGRNHLSHKSDCLRQW